VAETLDRIIQQKEIDELQAQAIDESLLQSQADENNEERGDEERDEERR
jgi:hypothetical protein